MTIVGIWILLSRKSLWTVGRSRKLIAGLMTGDVEIWVISWDWASGEPFMIWLASACRDKASPREIGHGEEDDNSVYMINGTESVVVELVGVGVSSSESVVVAGLGNVCCTLLDNEFLRWPLWKRTTSWLVISKIVSGPSQPFPSLQK